MLRRASLPICTVVSLAAVLAGAGLSGAASAATDPMGADASQLADLANRALVYGQRIAAIIADWAVDGSRRFPAIMVGLAGLVVLPTLAVLGWLILRGINSAEPQSRVTTVIELPRSAWMRIEGEGQTRLAIDREFVQIGRGADNDICLGDRSVHRYHALIERFPDTGYCIIDVSGPNGHGVSVNGRRLERAWLESGDVVQIGKSRLRFETAA